MGSCTWFGYEDGLLLGVFMLGNHGNLKETAGNCSVLLHIADQRDPPGKVPAKHLASACHSHCSWSQAAFLE
jgi:hypothetical protein